MEDLGIDDLLQLDKETPKEPELFSTLQTINITLANIASDLSGASAEDKPDLEEKLAKSFHNLDMCKKFIEARQKIDKLKLHLGLT